MKKRKLNMTGSKDCYSAFQGEWLVIVNYLSCGKPHECEGENRC